MKDVTKYFGFKIYKAISQKKQIKKEAEQIVEQVFGKNSLKKNEEEKVICQNCGKEKPKEEVYERLNPFHYEINNEEIYQEMCDECEEEYRCDI